MTKTHAKLIHWDEITNDTDSYRTSLSRGDDDALIQELRHLNHEINGWELVGIAHLPRTTIIEWKSDRGHHATTQICWS